MDANDRTNGPRADERIRTETVEVEPCKKVLPSENHIVFDFTGLKRPDVADLALILTARLQTPAHERVWVRAIDPWTVRVLRGLGLDHLFRHYPGSQAIH